MNRAVLVLVIGLLSWIASFDQANAQNRNQQGNDGDNAVQDGNENGAKGRRPGPGNQAGNEGPRGEGFRGGPGGQGGGPMPGPSILMIALDENADGEISAEEIEIANESLRSLDKNGDGKLNDTEVNSHGPGPGQGPPGGRPEGRGPGAEGPGPGQGGPGSGDFLARLMEADQDSDGKLSKEEVPERMQRAFERMDADGDGFLAQAELQMLGERRREGGPGGQPKARGGEGPPGLGSGVGSPDAMVDHLFQLDANGDGNLTREELAKGAAQFGNMGRRGDAGPQGGEAKPRRPQRPDSNEDN